VPVDQPDQVKAALKLYLQKGDMEGALLQLDQLGWERSKSMATLRQGDLAAARATAILSIVLFVCGVAAWMVWPDARWLLLTLLAWAIERAFRAVKLVRRAKAS